MNPNLVGPIITAITAFVGVLLGTVVVPWIRAYFSRRESARYLAIRVVCILDQYIDDCAAVASDWGDEDEHGCSVPQVSEPSFPTYPSDLDWRSIDYPLMYELLALPAAAQKAANAVEGASAYADPPDYEGYFETRSFGYATIGLRAFDLAVKLRKKYRIRDLDRTEWDPVDHLRKELRDINERRQKRVAAWEAVQPPRPTALATETPVSADPWA